MASGPYSAISNCSSLRNCSRAFRPRLCPAHKLPHSAPREIQGERSTRPLAAAFRLFSRCYRRAGLAGSRSSGGHHGPPAVHLTAGGQCRLLTVSGRRLKLSRRGKCGGKFTTVSGTSTSKLHGKLPRPLRTNDERKHEEVCSVPTQLRKKLPTWTPEHLFAPAGRRRRGLFMPECKSMSVYFLR